MSRHAKFLFAMFCMVLPAVCQAQNLAQVDCSRQDSYTYLYSSTTTMEVRTTLKCGQQLRVLGRFDNFYRVRTDNGEDGFVPVNSISFIKGAPGTKTTSRTKGKTNSAPSTNAANAPHPAPVQDFLLPRQTAVHLKFTRTVSSANAKVGEEVSFEVAQDVVVNGLRVIAKGAPAVGTVAVAEPKRRMGHGGKLSVSVTSVRLADNENLALRSYQEDKGAEQKAGKVIPLMRGKDITFAEGSELTAYVDADVRLKIAKFHAAPAASATAEASGAKP